MKCFCIDLVCLDKTTLKFVVHLPRLGHVSFDKSGIRSFTNMSLPPGLLVVTMFSVTGRMMCMIVMNDRF